MSNPYFKFKKFTIYQDKCAMKVTTLACIQGAWLPTCKPKRILDIGSGTGLLSLMAAQQYGCRIDAVEIDEDAFAQLSSNIESSPWGKSIVTFHDNILTFARHHKNSYDLIITNPPFFTNHLQSPNSRINMARHNLSLSLPELVECAAKLLSNQGRISVLLPPEQTAQAESLFRDHSILLVDQLSITDRMHQKPKAIVSIFAREKIEVINKTLIIKTDDGSYTSEFKALLKDYYLNL